MLTEITLFIKSAIMKRTIVAVASLLIIFLSSCEVEVRDGVHYHHPWGYEHRHYPDHHEVYNHGYHHVAHGGEIIVRP